MLFNWVLKMADGGQLLSTAGREEEAGWRGSREGLAEAKYTKKLMNDKELTSFRKLTNWSTVK